MLPPGAAPDHRESRKTRLAQYLTANKRSVWVQITVRKITASTLSQTVYDEMFWDTPH